LTPATIAYFGVDYCAKGLMKGCIAIPLHDSEGRLIGYADHLVDDASISDEEPKYKLPGSRKKEDAV